MEPCRELVIAGRYRLDEEIGRGGVGRVWRAHAMALDIPCAIKFLLPQFAADPGQRARFVHEARAAAGLRSQYTVAVFDVDEWEGQPFIAMELLAGQSLEQCLRERGTLSPRLTCEVVRQIALGLSKAHAAGLVHRDLKPDNVFLLEEDPISVKILDFGIAKRLDMAHDFKTATGALIGTPYYMSPEQAMGSKDVDLRSDVWSLAVLAYRCLTGRLPFGGDSLPEILVKIVHGPLPTLVGANPSLPKAVESWWRSAANRAPAQRTQSASELARGLERALFGKTGAQEHMASGTRLRPSIDPPPRSAWRSGRGFALFCAAVAALGLGVAYWWMRPAERAREEVAPEHRVEPSAMDQPPAAPAAVMVPDPVIVADETARAADVPEAPPAVTVTGAAQPEPEALPDATLDSAAQPISPSSPEPARTRPRVPSRPAAEVPPPARKPPEAAPPSKRGPGLDDRLGF
jgi:eukaryotic-like serine/threonine-protein kinase